MSASRTLSLVITTRNDDFGGDMLRRLQLFVENVLELGERHSLDAEIIIVEWNPPEGPRLHDVLEPRRSSARIPVRFIEVPPEAHARFRNHDLLPLFQMIAKNVGIRRAAGRFVLATNQDVLLSDPLVSFLAGAELDPGVMYRIDRADCAAEVPWDATVDDQLAWCEANLIRLHRRHGTFPAQPSRYSAEDLLNATLKAAVKSILASRGVHTNACGDFTLCHRDVWERVRGYAEIPIYSLHVDSLFCYAAMATGLRQEILRAPLRCYHLEHQSSWAVMSPEEKLRWFRDKPWLDTSVLQEAWREMLRTGEPIVTNDAGWGLGDLELRETALLDGKLISWEGR